MRPRSSILDLFDPLVSTDLSRDAPSPDADTSDKENCLDSEFFFGQPLKAPSPVRLKRRLVDVGDITIDDPTIHPMLTEEDELDDSMCDDDDTMILRLSTATPARDITVQKASPSNVGLRTPLAELSIDPDITPIARTKMYRRQPPSALASSDIITPASLESSTFASVIDAVTASGVSFAGPARPSPDHESENEAQPVNVISCDNGIPQITIPSIDEFTNSTPAFSLATPPSEEDAPQPSTSLLLSESSETSISIEHPRTTLRSSLSKSSSQDKKRHSIDLYTSFHLQLQSEEASFDLLNDKISLFASSSSMDSFHGLGEDDSFDMAVEEAKLQTTIDTIKLEQGERKDSFCSPDAHLEQNPICDTQVQKQAPHEPTEEENNECPEIAKQTVGEPSILPPVFGPPLHDQGCAVLCTPAPNVREQILPPAVPALRIVKRSARPAHEKSASTSSAASATSEGPAITAPATASVAPIRSPITQHVSSTDINRVTRVRSAASEPSAILPPASTGNGTSNGPRRVPIGDSQPVAINKRRGFVDQRNMPQGKTTGPRRVIVTPSVSVPPAAPVPVPASSKASAVSGLKAPTKYGLGTTASALPRPVSRLPTAATSGIARPPRTGAGANAAGAGTSQGNVKRATYARRAV
ncbi:hypothetical protein C0995_004265 [Termitomyces sp. Mi166|nr:hypothetical protein C0995_004265 [Termitomyces sp. Mi166\